MISVIVRYFESGIERETKRVACEMTYEGAMEKADNYAEMLASIHLDLDYDYYEWHDDATEINIDEDKYYVIEVHQYNSQSVTGE